MTRAAAPQAWIAASIASRPIEPLSFVLYSRAGCGLCEEMLAEIACLPAARGIPVRVVDVDLHPETRVRYGHKVPVLLFEGELVCHGHLDPAEVHKSLALHRRPV